MEEKVKSIIEKYGSDKSFIIPILQDIQREFNYLPREALDALSRNLGVPPSLIYHLATFYRAFSLNPKGKYRLNVCMGTACHVRGAPQIADYLERTLDLKAGETSKNLEYSLETVNCLGACALGPILVVNDEYHGQMTIAKTAKVLEGIGAKVEADE
ncbi:MAG: NAD(P)H-dependent oxidoreductase subunit E [Candidatus Krumholzibacteria bacterium]|nr:NAD(P)H-dependent oxidoreductase subunit E [Candidatus Krumholzibacteria bacterium]